MGASCRRRAEAATAATASGAGAMSPRPAPEIREAWLLAVQEDPKHGKTRNEKHKNNISNMYKHVQISSKEV